MRVVKKYIVLSVFLLFYITAVSILFRQFRVYQEAYTALSILISHDSIDVSGEEEICR